MANFRVKFDVEVINLVVYTSRYYWGTNPWNNRTEKYFSCGEVCYMFESWGNYTSQGARLREITQDEYATALDELFGKLPNGTADDGKNVYKLENADTARFCEEMFSNECSFTTDSPLKRAYDAAEVAYAEECRRQYAAEEAKRKAYARECGKIARRLKVPFGMVLAFQQDEEAIKSFYQSLETAKERLRGQDQSAKVELYHELYECGRARKAAAMAELGINWGSADPNRLSLDTLLPCFKWRR